MAKPISEYCKNSNDMIGTLVITNGEGTSGRGTKCSCPNWRDHWKLNAKRKSYGACRNKGCSNAATCGGHVRVSFEGRSHFSGYFIVPICSSCNRRWDGEAAPINANTRLVYERKCISDPIENKMTVKLKS